MEYVCRLHGEVEINDPVVIELINTPEMQRLKEIDQAGYFEGFFPNTKQDRYEHSLGCYLLLKRFNAPIEEQIAGLLHDVSHAAFSHCADYVLAGGSEKEHTYQDSVFCEYVLNSSIPAILKKYGFDTGYIINEVNFPLQETELPDLCADRIDYSLRSLIVYGIIDQSHALALLNNLVAIDGHWVFQNLLKAKEFAELFRLLNEKYYAGIESAVMFRTVSDCLKYAIFKNYISQDDLNLTDDVVIAKIKRHLVDDFHLRKLFARMNNETRFENNELDYESSVYCKSRVVDPFVSREGFFGQRLSDFNLTWKTILEEESKAKQYFLKFFD